MSRRYITIAEQTEVIDRANRRCEYCKSTMDHTAQSFVMEHIVPISEGGETTLSNLALACGGCNGHKYNKTEAIEPETQRLVPLYHPREQIWQEHFVWSEDLLQIVGLTATGRATIAALKMNRPVWSICVDCFCLQDYILQNRVLLLDSDQRERDRSSPTCPAFVSSQRSICR